MKILSLLFLLLFSTVLSAQSIDLSGKKFEQIAKIPNSTTHLYFKSNTESVYVMTNVLMSGKTYIDECPCKTTVKGNNIEISCVCDDKEIYPDPINDSFIYDVATNSLKSTSYSDRDRNPIYWKFKN
jgi:hypothetical protein